MTPLLFLCKIVRDNSIFMDKERLKLIVRNLELLVDSLKAEVYSDKDAYMQPQSEKRSANHDYDEIWDDDDGYQD